MVPVYDLYVPAFIKKLEALIGILEKAKVFADERKIDFSILLQTRLFPDQFPLSKQIQIACDNAKFFIPRLTDKTVASFEDNETTYEEFVNRIQETIHILKSVKPEDFSNFASKTIAFRWNPGSHLDAQSYLAHYAQSNFFFHMTTAYSILRNAGVPLGKSDFMGPLPWIKD
jgi:hypothetical protein